MKKQKRFLCIVIALMSLVLSGCGTQLYEMTKEEEDLIVQSAAYFVAKHNIQQKDGVSAVVDPDSIVLKNEIEEASSEEVTEEGQVSEGGASSGELIVSGGVSLADIMGLSSNVTVSYVESYVADNYVEGSAYFVEAEKGKTFYVMKFSIQNTSDDAVVVDNAAIHPVFKLVSGNLSVKSEVTFLTTDFSTYQGTIKAGETVETILLFEVSNSQAEQIVAPELQISVDNEIKNVKL